MSTVRPLATGDSVIASTLSNRFAPRLVVSILLTSLDAATALFAGPSAYLNSVGEPLLRAALLLLFLGMLGSLSHVWFLTIRDYRALHPSK